MNGSSPPSVSIIIPAYNAANTISQCLDSVFKQVGPGIEVIVVDDCSSDATREIASKYAVQLIAMNKHRGAGATRNCGTHAARGPVLFFVDSDVTLGEGTLARAVADIQEPGGGCGDRIVR